MANVEDMDVPRCSRRLTLALLSVALLAVTACSPGALGPEDATPTATSEPSPTVTEEPEDRSFSMSVMGDWLPHDSVVADAADGSGGYDFARFTDSLRGLWEQDELVYCNQEVTSAGELPISYFPQFNAPPELADGMHEAGCNVIGLGNNHTFDHGQPGIDGTLEVWDGLGPELIAGANRSPEEQLEVASTDVNGISVSFVNFVGMSNMGSNDYALDYLTDHDLRSTLMEEASQADVTIVAVHWGDEYSHRVNGMQREYAEILVEEGADVIIGTHPHVVQPVEWLPKEDGTEALVFYSLGNFLSTQMAVPRIIGLLGQFDVTVDADGLVTIDNARSVPTYMHFDLSVADYVNENWVNRTNLQVYPLWDTQEPLSRSAWRNDVTVESLYASFEEWAGEEIPIVRSEEEAESYRP
ncbi:MAG TPA: CapA family protein [Candidatus Agrococcus pullicola]|uniref:CapA family protein n=1 Tax=Candidatus Agrococcus pullicola TaxID=2838429 RepID=A0A9D1YUL6_9MICO|nr:CapA family protein [Candidatus Agrococcus pullicola]